MINIYLIFKPTDKPSKDGITTKNNLSEYNLESIPNSKGMRFAIIVSEWNNHITEKLFEGAEKLF